MALWPSRSQRVALSEAVVKSDWPTEEAYRAGAERLGLEVAILKAFAAVEAGREGGFLDTGEPLVLLERHLMERYTDGRFHGARDTGEPKLPAAVSLLSWPKAGGYGAVGIQHRKLAAAAKLDREAALMATSWGLFQVLGSNHERAGFATLQDFINSAYRDADAHLGMLVSFIETDPVLHGALRMKDWNTAADHYNGKGQKGYDAGFAAAYLKLTKTA